MERRNVVEGIFEGMSFSRYMPLLHIFGQYTSYMCIYTVSLVSGRIIYILISQKFLQKFFVIVSKEIRLINSSQYVDVMVCAQVPAARLGRVTYSHCRVYYTKHYDALRGLANYTSIICAFERVYVYAKCVYVRVRKVRIRACTRIHISISTYSFFAVVHSMFVFVFI